MIRLFINSEIMFINLIGYVTNRLLLPSVRILKVPFKKDNSSTYRIFSLANRTIN